MPSGRRKTGKVTMQDIADRLGISKVSVSKAFSGKGSISAGLRLSIFNAAREMGYERTPPDSADRFAFIVPDHFFLETDAFYSDMYGYFSRECQKNGCLATLVIVSRADREHMRLPVSFQMEAFSGMAVAGEMPDAYLKLLEKPDCPMVLLDFDSRAVSASAVLTENYHWGCLVTQHLADLGHRRIGFVGQPGATRSITDRYFGYRSALLLNKLPYREEWLLVNNDTLTGLYRSDIPLPREMPTAFVCHCDMAAHYLLATLNQQGLRCPEDVSIVSFDNTRLAETCRPALTSVAIDTKAFARLALELLTDSKNRGTGRRIYLPASLVRRSSDGPAPEGSGV